MSLVYVILLISCVMVVLLSAGNANGHHDDCPDSFDCGTLGTFSFPFTTVERHNCGVLAIQGCNDPNQTSVKYVQLNNKGKPFQVTHVSSHGRRPRSISIIDKEFSKLLENGSCAVFNYNITVPPSSPMGYFDLQNNISTFNCSHHQHKLNHTNDFINYTNDFINYTSTRCPSSVFYFAPPSYDDQSLSSLISLCSMVKLPVRQDSQFIKNPFGFLNAEITFEFTFSDDCIRCSEDGRSLCRPDSNGKFHCASPTRKSRVSIRNLGLLLAWTLVAMGVVVMILVCCIRTKIFSLTSLLWWRETPTHRIIEELVNEHGPLPTTRYNYLEVKKMTNSFGNKLGQGGFGSVYKGKLQDGRLVAVKILSESKGNGEEFINEVASISRTSHVNIVRLLGFCLDSSKRALIYEFMPNGSLDKFIYEEKNPLQVPHHLNCKILYDIAIGIARGLEYLHRGCNTRILHFDIKPHNILLDEDFCPKISDFGLAKICPRKESKISIFGARGTAGYIAPEVFSRNFGEVSHKSDVYSYGMMVLEMVGGRKNIKTEVDRSSEIYFPHWIYERLASNQELGLQNIRNESDDKMTRKMTIVGLWCIQTHPSTRPTISKVVEMLESEVEFLQIPPKPFLSSPSSS
ncbi:LEAF RUST 10 DISEASE-RESISTANCE LOCUS RECEPTOR-LIKE PROTEIN KINASE-like 2.5 [Glycine soja]|uniref:LEAF RUST 10 DISEASE-RESISTANCE LOCUS RECEPTOR-LIKE PROTEIN KINASE-like 2.5 n=2 Tax=Glycine soja TaxID=3848 RepID=A0A445F3T1_GLYSO|nr:LEAF RUST 10 DISEASE-RESISTANCE LOCUS RECEPTOR-LIKE PROTEIN KINASE-like 2.5 [Glycine soja]